MQVHPLHMIAGVCTQIASEAVWLPGHFHPDGFDSVQTSDNFADML